MTEETEDGRRLASEREDLIAAGVDPAELLVPLAPASSNDRAGERPYCPQHWGHFCAHPAEPDAGDVEALIAEVEAGTVIRDPDGSIAGYCVTSDEWRSLRSRLRTSLDDTRRKAAESVVADVELAKRIAADERAEQIAAYFQEQAAKRFDVYGPYDARGAALWDAATHIRESR